jgi:hypothetical protein
VARKENQEIVTMKEIQQSLTGNKATERGQERGKEARQRKTGKGARKREPGKVAMKQYLEGRQSMVARKESYKKSTREWD